MNRVVTGLIGLIATAAVLVGCSDDKGGEPAPEHGRRRLRSLNAVAPPR